MYVVNLHLHSKMTAAKLLRRPMKLPKNLAKRHETPPRAKSLRNLSKISKKIPQNHQEIS